MGSVSSIHIIHSMWVLLNENAQTGLFPQIINQNRNNVNQNEKKEPQKQREKVATWIPCFIATFTGILQFLFLTPTDPTAKRINISDAFGKFDLIRDEIRFTNIISPLKMWWY